MNDFTDSKKGLLLRKKGSNNLVLSFGGIRQGLGIPVFEFFNTLNNIDCDHGFVRDFYQMWYQKGVDDEINSCDKLQSELQKIIASYEKVTFVGNSMGGYAAILFGVLLNVRRIISFSPQTFIDLRHRFLFWDRRWKSQISNIHKAKLYPGYYDLKKVMANNRYDSEIFVHYSKNHRLDKIHAQRIGQFKGVSLCNYEVGGHEVVKIIRDSGDLLKILEDSF